MRDKTGQDKMRPDQTRPVKISTLSYFGDVARPELLIEQKSVKPEGGEGGGSGWKGGGGQRQQRTVQVSLFLLFILSLFLSFFLSSVLAFFLTKFLCCCCCSSSSSFVLKQIFGLANVRLPERV